MPGRILVVEDDPAISRSLFRLLAHEEYYVKAVRSAEEAAACITDDPNFDLVLLDVALPGADGFACCRLLRAKGWQRPIVMLTGRGGSRDKITGLEAGADDYVTKPFDPPELLARVRAQLRRSRDYNKPEGGPAVTGIGPALVVDPQQRDAVVNGEPAHLTAHEYNLLSLMARHIDQPLHKSWLFQQIWGCSPEAGSKLLAVTVRRLRLKIEDNPEAPDYIQTVRGYGYRLQSQQAKG